MSFQPPQLAGRPFVNLRPIRRLSILMWVLGAIVLALNIWLYGTHVSALGDDRERLQDLETRIAAKAAEVDGLESQLGGLQLSWQNRQAAFLNHLIDQRTFSWSDLIDRLADVLPPQVRLTRLTPRIDRERRSQGDERELRVALALAGSAADNTVLLQFLDQLFSHPGFEDPRLAAESRGDRGEIASFTVTVVYLPAAGVEEGPNADPSVAAVAAVDGVPAAVPAAAATPSEDGAP